MEIEITGDMGLKRLTDNCNLAQKWLDNEVIKDTTPYVPMNTGTLYKSAITGSKIGSGVIEYSTPYARNLYYGDSFNFSKAKHPQAQSRWFEASKAVNLTKWLVGVRKLGGKQ